MAAALKEEERTVLVVTAGLVRSGKSTAMNNIFCADFESQFSAFSVTRTTQVRCVDGYKDKLIVVDTPGLGATDIKIAKIKDEIQQAVGGLNFVLVYVHSVSPTSTLTKTDEGVVKDLQKVLGKEIWKKCVILFSCSDQVREQVYPEEENRQDYVLRLREHARRLSEMLKKVCGPHVPQVKVVFDVDVSQQKINEIVAIPVGCKIKEGQEAHHLVPGVQLPSLPDTNWRDLALFEIIRKADPMDRGVYLSFAHNRESLLGALTGFAIGAAVGGVGGTIAGLALGGFGAIPGALVGAGVGAAAGAAAGSVVGGTAGAVTLLSKQTYQDDKTSNKLVKLKNAKHVSRSFIPMRPRSVVISRCCRRPRSLQRSCQKASISSGNSLSRSAPEERPLMEDIYQDCLDTLSIGDDFVAAEEPTTYVDPEEPDSSMYPEQLDTLVNHKEPDPSIDSEELEPGFFTDPEEPEQ